jgi:hypothetical protein
VVTVCFVDAQHGKVGLHFAFGPVLVIDKPPDYIVPSVNQQLE